MKFIHLHNHTCRGSFLDAISTPEELILRAKELGMSAISVNDHSSINALPLMLKLGKEHGIKSIIGVEFYVVFKDDMFLGKKGETRYHLNVMAKNWDGVKMLFKKLTLANTQKFIRPRLYDDQIFDFGDNVIISTACAISMLRRDDYESIIEKFIKAYGENFFLEIIPTSFRAKDNREKKEIKNNPIEMPDQAKIINLRIIDICKKYNVTLVCSMDTHFAYPEHRLAHEVSLCIATRGKMSTPRENRFYFDGAGINNGDSVYKEFKKLGYIDDEIIKIGINNSVIMANKCNEIIMPEFTFNLPKAYDGDDYEIFRRKILEGFERLGYSKKPNLEEYKERIRYEVSVIKELNLVKYFLLVEDIMRFCRENNIPTGCARGSAGASLVASCLGITRRLDPIKEGLIFERFLNRHRVSQADFDNDISANKIHILIDYLYKKYGKDYVSPIGAFTELTPKNTFKDVLSAFDFPFSESNKLSALIDSGNIKEGKSIIGTYSKIESFDHVPELIKFKNENQNLIEIIKILNGRIRQATKHACGLIISSIPLSEVGVIECRKNNEFCLNWDKNDCEYTFKLLKIDLLKLLTVTITDSACNLISKRHNIDLKYNNIPIDDEKTKKLIAKGDTLGIFQFEGTYARKLLSDSNLGSVLHCSAISSALRPGPSGAILEDGKSVTQHYVDRACGKEEVSYLIPQYENILKDTMGLMLYQEELMSICTNVAGFTMYQSDTFRKLVSKKMTKEEFELHRDEFVNGCTNHSNLPTELSNSIFDSFLSCVRYLFSRPHAFAYAILSHEAAFLKAHYPLEFYCANLTYSDDEKRQIYIKDAKKHNIIIKTPDINISHATEFIIHDEVIYAPLSISKYVGFTAAESIIRLRTENFKSIDHFNQILNDNPKHKINSRAMTSLYYSNAFKSIGHYEKDPETLATKMIEYLPIFSTLPHINLNNSNPINFNNYNNLQDKISECLNTASSINKPSNVICIIDIPKYEDTLLQKHQWFIKHLQTQINSDIYFTPSAKCKQCDCTKILTEEIEIINPVLIINCSSKTAPLLSSSKFSASFGEIIYSDRFKCHLINCPSPSYMSFKPEIKQEYIDKIMPLWKHIKRV